MEIVIIIAIVAISVGYVAYTYYRSAKKHMSDTEPGGCNGDCAGCGLVSKKDSDTNCSDN